MSIYGPDVLLEDPKEGNMEELKRFIAQRMQTYEDTIEDTVREWADAITREYVADALTRVMDPVSPGDATSNAYAYDEVKQVIEQLTPKEVYHLKQQCGLD